MPFLPPQPTARQSVTSWLQIAILLHHVLLVRKFILIEYVNLLDFELYIKFVCVIDMCTSQLSSLALLSYWKS